MVPNPEEGKEYEIELPGHGRTRVKLDAPVKPPDTQEGSAQADGGMNVHTYPFDDRVVVTILEGPRRGKQVTTCSRDLYKIPDSK